jgi:tape measure domain-containing protein
MSVKFALALLDMTSGPARAAGRALAAVEGKLRALQAAAGVDIGKKVKGSTSQPRDELARLKAAGQDGTSGLAGGALGATSAMAGLAAAIGVAAVAGLGLAAAGASYAADMAGFKGQAAVAFKFITGSQQKAGEVMTMADELARSMGAKTTDVTESIRELMAGGFGADQAKGITAAVADIRAMNPKANIEAIATQIAQMKGAGRVLAEDLKPLLNAGINDDIFYQVLREMTGQKDQVKLKKMMESGKVSSDQGIAAILETVKRMGGGGPLGAVAAEKASTSVAGAIENTKAMFERLFIAINSGAASKSLIAIAGRLANLFDPAQPSGQRLLATLDKIAGMVGRMFERLDLEMLIGGLFLVVGAVDSVITALSPLGEGLLAGLGEAGNLVLEVLSAVMGSGGAAGSSKDLAEALRMVGTAIGYVVVGIGVVVAMAGWLAVQIARVAAFVGAAAGAIGIALVDGIGGGLDAAWQGLVTRLGKLTSLLPDVVRKVLGIASPSKVMMQLGGYTAEGFALGVERGAATPGDMAGMLTAPAALGALPGGAEAGGGAAPSIALTIQVDASGRDDAQEIAALAASRGREMLVSVFERMALTSGATVPT